MSPRIIVNDDGSFTPMVLNVRAGETVEWYLHDRTDAIVPTRAPGVAGASPLANAYDPTDPNDFTGPLPLAPSGVFTLSPLDQGLRAEQGRCTSGPPKAVAGNSVLCSTGDLRATMDSTWADSNITGVFIRLEWSKVQPSPGTEDDSFDFTVLDREIDKAVAHGKLYSLAVKAGKDGTPDWIFSTDRNGVPRPDGGGGVVRLSLRDIGGDDEAEEFGCGFSMDLGSPTDPMYQSHYFAMLTKIADRIRSRADWYRNLAYIKPSGANLISHENRLPKRCKSACPCNTMIFATNGYTPAGLYDFYRQQFDLLADSFPGKALSYALIQAGFPRVNDSGGWEQSDGTSSDGNPLPATTEQTRAILDIGAGWGERFAVQHNGLGPGPTGSPGCPTAHIHPAQPPFDGPAGCPNALVLRAGSNQKQITGFQTNNASKVGTIKELEATLDNALQNSDASFVEIYEERLWEAVNTNESILPSGRTIGQWTEEFHLRRRELFPHLADPFPMVHRHTFGSTGNAAARRLLYFNASTFGRRSVPCGTILLSP